MPSTLSNHLARGFGVEIECYLPEGQSSQAAAAAVTSRIGKPISVTGYNHIRMENWKIVPDGSLGDPRGIEFVSPVLNGEAGLAEVEKVCEALTDFGCTVSKKCGLHVHVGVGAPDLQFFKNIARIYSVFEPVIDTLVPVSRRASNCMFARSVTGANPQKLANAATFAAVMQATTNTMSNEARYYKLNLSAHTRHKTVEFRQHSGTLDGRKAAMWARLCLRLVAAAFRGPFDNAAAAPVAVASFNQARPGSKAWQIGQMLLRPEGVTGNEVCAAMNWPSVSMPAQARMCGIEFTTQRTGREVRYFAQVSAPQATTTAAATPITLAGLLDFTECSETERSYFQSRARDLSGSVAWAA